MKLSFGFCFSAIFITLSLFATSVYHDLFESMQLLILVTASLLAFFAIQAAKRSEEKSSLDQKNLIQQPEVIEHVVDGNKKNKWDDKAIIKWVLIGEILGTSLFALIYFYTPWSFSPKLMIGATVWTIIPLTFGMSAAFLTRNPKHGS